MKYSIVLFFTLINLLIYSCASDSGQPVTTTASTDQVVKATSDIAEKSANAITDISNNVTASTDKVMPTDDKIDETVDKVAEKAKSIFKKGKKAATKTIDNTTSKISEKAEKVADNISQKGEEISNKIEQKVEQTSSQISKKIETTTEAIEQKVDEVLEEVPEPPTPTEVKKPAPKVTETTNVVDKKVWGAKDKPKHEYFNTLLQKHVTSDGKVNYKGFKAENHLLEDYISQLQNNPVHPDWSRAEKLAYWINAYNAYTIKMVVDAYPIKSIKDVANGKPWDKKWIKLSGKTYSLNNIENDIIRPTFNEPRIHFAVNCAARSCPPIANKAYTATNLESLLESSTKKFVNSSRYNSFEGRKASVSKLFDWYKADFGDLTAFLNKYLDSPLKSGTKVNFADYDWSLNE